MPLWLEFDSTNEILRCRLEGCVTDEALKEYYQVVQQFATLIAPRASILDFSAVTSLEVSRQTVLQLAESSPAVPDPNCPRIIVASSPKIFGLARMFELEGQNTRPNLHVVRNQQEAWAILGVQNPKFEPLETA
jgi:hypothetical protein